MCIIVTTAVTTLLCVMIWQKREATIFFAASLSIILWLVILPAIYTHSFLTVAFSAILAILGTKLETNHTHSLR